MGQSETYCERRQVVSIIAVEMFGIVALQFMQKCQATIKIQSDSNSCQFNANCAATLRIRNMQISQTTVATTVWVDYTRNMTAACCNL